MTAIGKEFPNMTLMAYRLFSDLPNSGNPARPVLNIESSPYGLLPAFVDGWCDALLPGISIVDGNEFAYGYESEQEYALTFTRLKLQAPQFVSPENRAKFSAQFRIGHGFYLDGYSPAPGGKARYDFKEQSALNRLTTFTAAALDAADGPVWIYGESAGWWPKTNRVTWPEKFLGIEAALRAAKDPIGFATEHLRDVKSDANRLRDANFAEGAAGRNAWFAWQAATSKGKTKQSDKAALLAGMDNGSLSQPVSVKPGEAYVVGARVKSTGSGDAGLSIGWQKEGGRWVATSQRVEFSATNPPDAEGWRQIAGFVHVPPDATSLGFVLFARKQDAASEVMFRDPIVVPIEKLISR
jgi:hypothetical protein